MAKVVTFGEIMGLKHTIKDDYNCISKEDVELLMCGLGTGRISR